VFAEEQEAGRGRSGARWMSEAGKGLLFSVLLRPKGPVGGWLWLSHAVGVAVCRGIEAACGVAVYLKWPNDVYSADHRKLCGILVESRSGGREAGYVVAGVGINVLGERFSEDLGDTAGSVAMLGGREVSREDLAARVLTEMERVYRKGQVERKAVIEEAEALSLLVGREIEFRQGAEVMRGRFLGLGVGGEMRVEMGGHEEIHVIQADEVRLA
jgi:BirA family biotin operon repressor/biotin-[acetyl-CoA-carboxylase] ligase